MLKLHGGISTRDSDWAFKLIAAQGARTSILLVNGGRTSRTESLLVESEWWGVAGMAGRTVCRKFQKGANKALGRDENAGKEVEEDVVRK